MWVRGIRLAGLFHTSYQSLIWSNWCSLWTQVLERNIEWNEKLRAASRLLETCSRFRPPCKAATGRVVSKLRKSSQAGYFWYESQISCQRCSTIDQSSTKLCWSYCLDDRLSSYKGSLSQGALAFPRLTTVLCPKSSWQSCYWKEGESAGTAGRAFDTAC